MKPEPATPFRLMLHGPKGSGKDTVARLLCEERPWLFQTALARPLKLQVGQMLNFAITTFGISRPLFTEEQLFSDEVKGLLGQLFQWYGTEFARAGDEQYWIDVLSRSIRERPHVVVTDCRFENEAEWGHRNGFLVAAIRGYDHRYDPLRGIRVDNRSQNHASEQCLPDHLVDLVIPNTGSLDELRERLDRLFP